MHFKNWHDHTATFLHLDYLVEIIDQLLFNKRDLKVYEYSSASNLNICKRGLGWG